MKTEPPVHPLATLSVVLPFVFVLPIIAGLGALIAGSLALKSLMAPDNIRRGQRRAMTGIALAFAHFAVVAAVVYGFALVVVPPGNVALVLRYGEIQRTLLPGTNAIWPFVEKAVQVPVGVPHIFQLQDEKYLLASKQTVVLYGQVDWSICNAQRYYTSLRASSRFAERHIEDVVRSGVRNQVAGLSNTPGESELQELEAAIAPRLNQYLSNTGVCVDEVALRVTK